MVAEIRDGRGLITTIEKDCEFIAAGHDSKRSEVRIVGRETGKGFVVNLWNGYWICQLGEAYQLADGIVAVAK